MAHPPRHVGYPVVRLDALTDGIFAVAMTLLVLDIRLPDGFAPANDRDMLQGLIDLLPKLFPYALSFFVLGMRWLATIQVRTRAETVGGAYIRWWLLSLLLTTCLPFSTMVVGRYASLAPAVWLYAGNTALLSLASWRQLSLLPDIENGHHLRGRQWSLLVLMGSSVLCIGWSFVNPPESLAALMLNAVGPALIRRFAVK